MKKEWIYSDVEFVADKYNDTLLKYSPWSGHRRFGYDFINFFEPEKLVELGSHYGSSAFSFLQSIKDNHLETVFYPIDLWEATDRFTSKDYEKDVYTFFSDIIKEQFSDANIELMKMSFDEACPKFENKSIDILHIDGSHDYLDVMHDYENWLPKMKEDGIILFHDISDQLYFGEKMGSCVFWNEIKKKYSTTIDICYSLGLGILFLSKEKYRIFLESVELDYYIKRVEYDYTECKDKIRRDYFRLLDNSKWIQSLEADKLILGQDNVKLVEQIVDVKNEYEKTISEKNLYIAELNEVIKKYQEEESQVRSDYEKTINGKDSYIKELNEAIRKYQEEEVQIRSDYEKTINGKDSYIKELESRLLGECNE